MAQWGLTLAPKLPISMICLWIYERKTGKEVLMWPLTGRGTKHPEVLRLHPWRESHMERKETGTRPDNLVPKQRCSPSFSKMFNPFSKTARAGVDYLALGSKSLEFPKGSTSMRPSFNSIPAFCKEQLHACALFTTRGLRLVQTIIIFSAINPKLFLS